MTQGIVLKSFEELGRFAGLVLPDEQPSSTRALVPVVEPPDLESDLTTLAEAAGRAATELCELVEADTAARRAAEEALTSYRRLQDLAARLVRVAEQANAAAGQASNLAERAFTPQLREKAREVATAVAAVAGSTSARLAAVNTEAALLSTREDIARLLGEEKSREEAARREAEERRSQERLREQIEQAETLAREGKGNEALRLLGQLVTEKPNEPSVASYLQNVSRRAWAVKTIEVEAALREARRVHRREPRQALAILEAFDLGDIPEQLVRQVYGCWLQACRRLNLEGAVHYSPAMGRGALLIPTSDGRLSVVSAIGLTRWQPGRSFSAAALKGARPLS